MFKLCKILIQVKHLNIGVTISFPPDTETPGFEVESKFELQVFKVLYYILKKFVQTQDNKYDKNELLQKRFALIKSCWQGRDQVTHKRCISTDVYFKINFIMKPFTTSMFQR